MPSTKVAVVIPTYKEELNELEKISLAQARKVLGKYPFVFVAPEGKNFSYFKPGDMIVHCPPHFFQNVMSYSHLMTTPQFYEAFLSFDYILIYQLDAFVFYDALEFFCSLGYDYIGAPWPRICRRNWNNVISHVGNGGFSLRNTKSCYKLVTDYPKLIKSMSHLAEDDFFAYCGANRDINFNVAPIYVAARFSVEYALKHSLKNIRDKLPFGCHGWTKMSADFYAKIFLQFGYDLRPMKNKLANIDTVILKINAVKIAMERLIRRAKREQSILRYLPIEHFDSVRVIRDSSTMRVLAQLLTEKNFLADKIFLYDKADVSNLVADMTRENLPHLLFTVEDYDSSLIDHIEKKGLRYGEHIISFRREYLNHCEKIFHNLGK